MPIKCEQYNGVCVVALDGDLAGEAAGAALRRAADERMAQKPALDFVVDLSRTEFIDSAGLKTLLWLKRRCDEGLGRVKLAAVNDDCRKILEMTRLDRRFECHADLSAALRSMS